jgi:HEAT repeat protein
LLVEHLASSDEDTVLWAAKSIALFGPIGGPAAPTLAGILADESRSHITRMMALEALSRIGPGEVEVLPAIIAILLSEADSGDALDRRIAACDALVLLRSGAAPALPYLIRLLNDESSRLRTSAAAAIGAIGAAASSAIESLVDVVLFDEAPEARDAAAIALGNMGEAAEPALLTLAQDNEAEVRRLAAVALVRVSGSADAVAALQSLAADDESELVRITAIESLRTLMAEPASWINAAIEVLRTDDRQVRIRAYRLLLEAREHADLILPRMMELEQDERRHVRDTARRFLEDWEAAEDSP